MRKVLAIALAGCVSALAISGWIFHLDDRQPSHSARVGTLVAELPEGRSEGTAVLVDECGILTTFHTVFGPWYVTALRPPSHEYTATFTLTEVPLPRGRHPTARATPVVWGDYRGPDRQFRTPENDWAYLVLDRCLGTSYGYFNLNTRELEADADRFVAIGYSSGRQMIDPDCVISRDPDTLRAGAWPHDCALQAGDSGGPIVQRGTSNLIALGSGQLGTGAAACAGDNGSFRIGWNPRCVNLAVPLSGGIIDRVREAEIAVGIQRSLLRLGYNAGPLAAVDEPRAKAAILEYQRIMEAPTSGEPSCALRAILYIRVLMI